MANAALDRSGPTRDNLEAWNYKAMLGSGTTYTSVFQVADPKTVMPFLYVGFGAPVLFVGMIYPLVQIAYMLTQMVGAPIFGLSHRSKHHQLLSYFLIGAMLAMLGLLSPLLPSFMTAILFMVAAVVIGSAQAIKKLAWSDMIRRIFSDDRRTALIYTQAGLAGLLTVPIALLLHAGIHFEKAIDKHLMLLWAGAAITLFSGVLLVLIREPRSENVVVEPETAKKEPKTPFLETIRAQYREVFQTDWYGRFIMARLMLLSVELAPPFYAIHAATMHQHTAGSLNTFVAATGIAVVVGAPLWRWTGRFSDGKVLVLGAFVGAAAGLWATLIDSVPSMRHPLTYALVFFLIGLANIGVSNARKAFLLKFAPLERQSYFIGLTSTFASGIGVFVALGFGAMAHMHGPIYAIFLIIGLNVIAAVLCLRVRKPAAA